MSSLFSPINIANVTLENRFVRSATYENMGTDTGEVTDDIIKLYTRLAKGGVGLIITGYFYIHPSGRGHHRQVGIHSDDMLPGLKKLVSSVHEKGGKIFFQIAHSGRQTTKETIGRNPMAPSKGHLRHVLLPRPKPMIESEILEIIDSFSEAAQRVLASGADGIQLHAAHGYLIHEFLSPYFNKRKDQWGGSESNQFRFLHEILTRIRKSIPNDYPISVKINAEDYTPGQGITAPLAVKYCKWMVEEKLVDNIEVSCGTTMLSPFSSSRGGVPIDDFVRALPLWQKPLAWLMLKRMKGQYPLEEGYNLEAAKQIKQVSNNIPITVVGGLRTISFMEGIINDGFIDLVALSRPFVKQPNLVNKVREGNLKKVACTSCNRCFAAFIYDLPLKCHEKANFAKMVQKNEN
ncbi:MAG: NADH:flavin oxidoreductase [Candidatus Hodarchaeales archaeon]